MSTTLKLIDQGIRKSYCPKDGWRDHGGFSGLGGECLRQLWYDWHWASEENKPAKILRKFERGHLNEDRYKRYLKLAGLTVCDVDQTTGKQFSFKAKGCGFLAGSVDGVISGLPELDEGEWALWEFKSMGNSTFGTLKRQGLEKANNKYWVQCHLYMHHAELNWCAFMAEHCDTQEIYLELFEVDHDLAKLELDKGKRILELWHESVPRIAENEAYYLCKNLCDHRDVCHRDAPLAVNCRTCKHMTPDFKGETTWLCSKHNVNLNRQGLIEACEDHQPIEIR